MLDTQLTAAVTAFLSLEADLLDFKDYDAWLDLWQESGLYIVPVDHNAQDFSAVLNVAYDDAEMRRLRVQRLSSGEAISTALAKPTVRTLSRVRVLASGSEEVHVRAACCLYEDNKNGVRSYPINLEYKLVPTEGSFKIQEKIARVMQSDQHLTTISYLF
ncbi:aromatic-ring-hydroxylating dioxygenase subunit beta [Halioxenophilus aromaticivorans]|uniref:Aromatic-ring-hydroxylating dioxygenase subunit beta n=1 Tax=Halioxenophilus aromaticivorans TaxID=1306992 RepID=A0AAV3U5V6_9ALTE